MKKDKIIYWISTGLVAAVMIFSVINFTFFDHYLYPEGGFRHLRLPGYLQVELTVAKLLGLCALLVPGVPGRIKEFAYVGFAITLISAIIAHSSVGDPFFPNIIDPGLFLGALIVSYSYYHKTERKSYDRMERPKQKEVPVFKETIGRIY